MAYIVNHKPVLDLRNIDGLVVWCRSDRGITLSSGKVSKWEDMSGYNNHFNQSTALNQPIYMEEYYNGRPVLSFDGTNSYMDATDNSTLQFQSGELFVLLTISSTANQFILGNTDWSIDRYGYMVGLLAQVASGETCSSTNFHRLNSSVVWPQNTPNLMNFSFVSTTTAKKTYKNGLLEPGSFLGTAATAVWNGYPLRLGRNANTTSYTFAGKIAEVMVFNRVLSDTERWNIRQYIFARYRLWG